MKHFYLILTFWVFAFRLAAQTDVTNTGAEITILGGTSVFINGSYLHTDNNAVTAPVANNGVIELKGNLINNTGTPLFTSTNGNVVFSSDTGQKIIGQTPILFSELESRTKDSALVLEVDITVYDSLVLSSALNYGNILLNRHNINLGYYGYLSGEYPQSRIFGDEGYLTGSRIIPDGTPYEANIAGIGLGFGSSSKPLTFSLGTVNFKRGHAPQAGATAKGGIRRYYIIEPEITDQTLPTLTFAYLDTVERKGLDETKFSVWKSNNGGAVWSREQLSMPIINADQVIADSVHLTGNEIILTVGETDCIQAPVVKLGNDSLYLCPSDTIILNAGNPGLFHRWNTGATSQTISVTEGLINKPDSIFSVRVTDANGCVGFDTVHVFKKPKPVIALKTTRLREVCLNDTSMFRLQDHIPSENMTFHWDFGVSNLSTDTANTPNTFYIYPEFATYLVKMTATSEFGCSFDTTFQHQVHPLPVAKFESLDICLGNDAIFENQSELVAPPASSYALKSFRWNFGVEGLSDDTLVYTAASPVVPVSYTYDTAAAYMVTLIAETNAGCLDTATREIEVFPLPHADFSFTTEVCVESSVDLTNNTVDSLNSFTYSWTFGDSFSSNLRQPEKAYEVAGEYNIQLKVTTENLCLDSSSATVKVVESPLAAFNIANSCLGDSVKFTNLSGQGEYIWDFGDGTASVLANPSKLYDADGSYPVKLIVSTGASCKDSIQKNAVVYPLPAAQFSYSGDLCRGAEISFQNQSVGASTYRWELGDGNISNQSNPTHSYTTAGMKTIILTAYSAQGCPKSESQSVTINELPVIPISNSITTCGSKYVLKLEDYSGIQSVTWNNAITADSFIVNSSTSVPVRIVSDQNCVSAKTVQVTLNSIFTPDLGNDTSVCNQHTLTASYPGSTRRWYFNSAYISDQSSILATNSGNYRVEVTDQNNCTGSDEINLNVNLSPVVDLGQDIEICSGSASVITAGDNSNTYSWFPGGESTPAITVSQAGTYSVTVTSPENCKASDQIAVKVNVPPIVDLGPDQMICEPVTLNAGNPGASYEWSTSEVTRTITASDAGTYWVKVTDPKGCINSDTLEITSAPKPVVDLGPDRTLCSGESVTLNAGNTGSGFLWNNGSTEQTLTVSSSGTYSVKVTNQDKCFQIAQVRITVMPKVQVNLGQDRVVCLGNSVSLDAGYPGSTYRWGSNNGFSALTQTVAVKDSGLYWVEVTTVENCKGTDTLYISVSKDTVFAEFLSVSLVDEGDTIQFINLSTQNEVNYQWDFGDGITSTAEDPMHVYYLPGNYNTSLTVSNQHCSAKVTKLIVVNPLKQLPDSSGDLGSFNEIVNAAIYPNPTSDYTNMKVELIQKAAINISVMDIQGRIIDSFREEEQILLKEIDVRQLPAGMYFIKVNMDKGEKILRLIKL